MKSAYAEFTPITVRASTAPVHDCQAAAVAFITEPARGEIYINLGPGDHTCTRWRLTESLARKLRRELNERLD